ncbi:hypothetical protein JYU34_013498 [Plutella xylostella]|uniref:Uncharacterized protein n=2 Tax=Plutella xylostella TaxID=51655 RepID=A0ABQ7QB85_PLUXY|nr:hypothetical protein JYU34_013498 [Plutella xylostella]
MSCSTIPCHILCPQLASIEAMMLKLILSGLKMLEARRAGRGCSCESTSEKVRELLDKFPKPPPPPALSTLFCGHNAGAGGGVKSIYHSTQDLSVAPFSLDPLHFPPKGKKWGGNQRPPKDKLDFDTTTLGEQIYSSKEKVTYHNASEKGPWFVLKEALQLLQLAVTATALIIYYLIYCYMQLIYLTLQSAVYLRNADGAMRVTIAVVIVSALVVAVNCFIRLQRLLGVIS